MATITIDIQDLDATHRVGRRLGTILKTGDVVALIGPLGSGKTTLVKAVADGAGLGDLRQVTSPTFVIVNEYDAGAPPTTLRLYHVDAYRLRGSDDLEALGFDEMLTLGAVLIEWADKVADLLPPETLTIEIEPVDDHRRRFCCSARKAGGPDLLSALQADGGLSPSA